MELSTKRLKLIVLVLLLLARATTAQHHTLTGDVRLHKSFQSNTLSNDLGIYNAGVERVNEYTAAQDPKYKTGGKADLYEWYI